MYKFTKNYLRLLIHNFNPFVYIDFYSISVKLMILVNDCQSHRKILFSDDKINKPRFRHGKIILAIAEFNISNVVLSIAEFDFRHGWCVRSDR